MRKLLTVALVVSLCVLAGCRETTAEKVEREVRNTVDDVTK